jgi:hypothetical protein
MIKNYQDLANLLCAHDASEESISHRVYKDTSCGAWAKLETAIPTGKHERQNWRVIILKVGDRFRAATARQERDGDWMPLPRWQNWRKWSRDLTDCVAWDAGLDERGYILDAEIVDYLTTEVEWGNFGLPVGQKYFEVSFDTYTGGYAPGVSFGSIVEGIDAYTEVESVAFPCEEQDIWDALQRVEDEANHLWMETHGCPECWGGEEVEGELGGRPVDGECSRCKGHGTII